MLGLCIQYASDFTFLYQSSRATFVAGNFDDLLYFTAYFVTATAMISFLKTYVSLQNKSGKQEAVQPGVSNV